MALELIRTNPDGERVQFRPDAAASFRRMEAQQGRRLDVNRTVVTWQEQNDLYRRRLAGKYPYAVAHPDHSNHVYRSDTSGGNAWDTDERGTWLDDNGWIADVRDEPWHREYRPSRDKYRNTPTTKENDDMGTIDPTKANKQVIKDAILEFMLGADNPPSGYGTWPFMQTAVWNAPIEAQTPTGHPLIVDGKKVRWSAGGFMASTTAQVEALTKQVAALTALVEQLVKKGTTK